MVEFVRKCRDISRFSIEPHNPLPREQVLPSSTLAHNNLVQNALGLWILLHSGAAASVRLEDFGETYLLRSIQELHNRAHLALRILNARGNVLSATGIHVLKKFFRGNKLSHDIIGGILLISQSLRCTPALYHCAPHTTVVYVGLIGVLSRI